ncbi:MAG: PASTA domain-containing protein, partial [Gaiellaceae bacterium]
ANQTISFGFLPSRTYLDVDFAVSATASSGLPVSFAASGSCTVGGTNVHLTGAGTCTLTASQGGSAAYNAAPSVSQSFSIAKASQTISFGSALPGRTYGDADFTVGATTSSGLPVSFTASGACKVTGTSVHLTGSGTCTLTASQSGDVNHNPAPSVSRTFAIAQPRRPAQKIVCRVPKVVGKALASAKTTIKKNHCRTGTVKYAYSKKIKKGKVASQSRTAGRVLAANTKINLVVSRGVQLKKR